mgnify:CR=1 FL=1
MKRNNTQATVRSNFAYEMPRRIWKIHTTKRACATKCNLNINLYDKLGGEGGVPPGGTPTRIG